MENGESTEEGALRETWEEARARVSNLELYRVFDLPYINQVYMFYRADLVDKSFSAGPESLDVQLFNEEDIPWDEIAFPVVADTLREFFEDRKTGDYPVRISNPAPVWHKQT